MDREIRILVAEEDSSFLAMMEDSLKASGSLYRIEPVSSGKECLERLRNEEFDIRDAEQRKVRRRPST